VFIPRADLNRHPERVCDAVDSEFFESGEAERLRRLARAILERQHAHAKQIAAMNALIAFRDHRAHAQQQRALAAQSRDEPDPYSLPPSTTRGTPAFWYFIAAS